ncbi:MAG: hypothetical protein C0621_00740 [Desulfuromonas sp.]|nr:MAG: hypothetical protein C0621_00740 [Desulfuromonas sp.]
MMATPSLGGERVAVVERGTALTVLETAKGWYRVESDGRSGWVSRLLVNEQPPLAQVSVLASSEEELDKSARRRASTFTTAAAARGLADRARVSQQYRADYEGVRKMESLEIGKDEALAFIAGEAGK